MHRKRWRDRNTEKWKREEKGEICLPFRSKTETLIQKKVVTDKNLVILFSSTALKPINIRWIRTDSQPSSYHV